MSENKNNITHRPLSPKDYSRQHFERALAELIGNFETETNMAVYKIEIERTDYDLYGDSNSLSRYPLRESPHGPISCVKVEFAKGPLVSATPLKLPVLAEIPELSGPAETIEEEALRLAMEEDRDPDPDLVKMAEEAGLEQVKTTEEAHAYGGRYA